MARHAFRTDHQRRKFHQGLTDALLEYAEAHFALSRPDAQFGQKTRLQVLLDVRRQTGVVAPELESLPVLPFCVAYLWEWFCDLSRGRGRDAAGAPLPIDWSAIWAFFDLLKIAPLGWEIRGIILLDDAYLDSRCGNAGRPSAKSADGLRTAMKGRG